ncbi:L,D-transpeptidase family protein [Pontibacter liquoris]|uniref:L,D-transpeptidase family protein n=1 Tax=Pontibacter liquoris TaxID=2905677 RepID=UPI001FA758F1|nr:L,D-transpeptidase family protein [Pontibacter liquoris]
MSPSNLKHVLLKRAILPFAAVLCLGLATGCNKTKTDDNSSADGLKGMFGKNTQPQVKTDSLFVEKYLQKQPEFKEHEDLMFDFYRARDYRLAWFRENKPVPQMQKLMQAIDHASKEGLDPKNYKIVDVNKLLEAYDAKASDDPSRQQLQQQIDVALTASYFNFASDFYRGRVNPDDVTTVSWDVKKNKIKLDKALQTILKERESTYPYYEFEALHAGYRRLRDKLQQYRDLQAKGGWPKIDLASRKSLVKGDTAAAVLALRQRLNPGQPLNTNDKNLRTYDEKLVAQVKHFQMLNGLDQDGVVGGNTLKALNVPLDDRIRQIVINMERWRWIPKRMVPKSLDQKYIWVNIPEYKLYVYEDPQNDPEAEREYQKKMEMRVIVGKTLHSTPIFSDKMEYVVLAPYWNVPNSIVEKEIKPHMLSNINWLDTQDMEIVTKEKEPQPVSPSSINWADVTEKNFEYMVRQRPGPKNSLGSLKFLFPNQYAVYLHDTPAGSLFSQTQRDFSHGCVRLEKPLELAKYVLQDMPEWDEQRIRDTIDTGEETWVTLPKKIQVYIVYFTAWVDENGEEHFRNDIYGHDKELAKEYFG